MAPIVSAAIGTNSIIIVIVVVTFAGGHIKAGETRHVAVRTLPSRRTHTLKLVAALNTRSVVSTRLQFAPVDEALATQTGKPRLAPTAERRGHLGAPAVVQTRAGVARVDGVLTVGAGKAGCACAVVAVHVVNTRSAVQTRATTLIRQRHIIPV